MVAVLVRYFGLNEVETAEDIVQDTLIEAMETWSIKGVPGNPEGWLMDVAKKKTINFLKRNQLFRDKIATDLKQNFISNDGFDTIQKDSTLSMIFTCCHPSISSKSQIALALKTLCGLSVPEIASALLTNEVTINKRLYRAKQKFRDGAIVFEIPDNSELEDRLDNVFSTLYLLFNEGYYSSHHEKAIRIDLCYEAIRLLKQIIKSFPDSYKSKSLLALMLLLIARFESRLDNNGALVILSEQNRKLWNKTLIAEGIDMLTQSTKNTTVNSYQLQAGIAAEHCVAESFKLTNWKSIHRQYLILEKIENTPIVRFNKSIAKFYAGDKNEALNDLLDLKQHIELQNSSIFHVTIGVFYSELDQQVQAQLYYKTALSLSKSKKEQTLIKKKIDR